MTTKQETAIRQHGESLQAIFPKTRDLDPVSLCRRLRRIEGQAERAALDHCNGVTDCDAWERESENILRKLDRILGYVAAGVPVFVNGDPRGYALKIEMTGWHGAPKMRLHRDRGGYGIIAPEIGPEGR